MIPSDTVAKILDTARIEEVVGDFVSLRRRGANLVACCPFHNEKTPSFYVSPSKGIYKCFGCGKSGTAVGFVMEHESLSYPEALKYLARKYNIEVVDKEETAEEIAARQRGESLLLTMDYAAGFFRDALSEGEGKAVGYRYFRQERGLEDETIRKYGLGWAPSGRTSLRDAALAKGFKEEYLEATGLVRSHDDGRKTDLFYERVMFPIHNLSGRIVAFGGRTLKKEKTIPKYVNSPETEIYVKNRSLYGIFFAKGEMSRSDLCYLVEGYLDVLSMHQLGITNVVASSGTSLTVGQIRLIKKFTENVTIMYDGDSAGIHAAIRGIDLVLKEGMNVRVVLLPDGDDPDSFSRKHTLQEVRDFIAAHEQDFIAFKSDLLLSEAGGDPLKRAGLINDIADTIALIPDAVKRTVYVQSSAEKFSIDQQILFERVRRTRERLLEEDRKNAERERRLSGAAPAVAAPEEPAPESGDARPQTTPAVVRDAAEAVFECPKLAPSERELLGFILTDGLSPLEFETDSEFYDSEGEWTVAEFIRSALEADRHELENSVYRRTWDAYFALYDSDPDLTQEAIVRRLMDGEDRTVADVAAALTQEAHRLTVKNFERSMTANSTRLVKYVPRAILAYQSGRLVLRGYELQDELKGNHDPAKIPEILFAMQKVASLRKEVDERLGRVQ